MTGPATRWTLGLDLGGTGVRAVAVDQDGEVLSRASMLTPASLDDAGAVELVRRLITSVTSGGGPAAIGIGASGPIDAAGVIQNPDTLPAFTGLELGRLLSGAFDAPVAIDNDAVTAALAEGRSGAAAGRPSFLHVTLGTGVGVCAIIDGRPLRGADGMHPEASHLGVAHHTSPCYCGRTSCWEQGASRTALQRAAAALRGLPANDPSAINAAWSAAVRGDQNANAVFVTWAQVLADGLAAINNLLRLPVVVLGGSATLAFDAFSAPLSEEVARLAVGPVPEIMSTALDDFGGAIGATLLTTGITSF